MGMIRKTLVWMGRIALFMLGGPTARETSCNFWVRNASG